MAETAFASRKDAAGELGFTRQRLEKLIKQGRIRETDHGVDMVHARKVRAEMISLRAPDMSPSPAPATPQRKPYSVARGAAKVEDEETGELFSYAEAKARRERANAELAEIKLTTEKGRLISRDEVREKEFAVARLIRDRILGFPPRVANFIPPEAMKLLTQECEQLVRELQDATSRIAEE